MILSNAFLSFFLANCAPPKAPPLPPKSRTNSKIERHSETLRKFCYHHLVEDPTKVVELDPLPNNSLGWFKT